MGRRTVWPGYRCVFNHILGGLLGSIMVMLGLSSLLHLPHHVVDMGATLAVEQIHGSNGPNPYVDLYHGLGGL
jgi:hypothetical protein